MFIVIAMAWVVSAAAGVATIDTLSESTNQLVGFDPARTFYLVTVTSARTTMVASTYTTTPMDAFVTVNHMGATTPVPLEYGINKVQSINKDINVNM